MADKICVYFSNEYRAILPREKTIFVFNPEAEYAVQRLIDKQFTVVNWNNVCFVNPYKGTDHEEADREV